MSDVGAFQSKIVSEKNGVSTYFEILAIQRPSYGPLELLEKRTRFREAIANMSSVGVFRRKIASEKNGVSRYFEIRTK